MAPIPFRPVCHRTLLALAFIPLSPSLIMAQRQVAATPESEILVLSPFEVSVQKDDGYIAANSLAGGRTDTPLKNTPAAISVLTREFLNDIAADNYMSAAEWSVNAVPSPTNYESAGAALNGGYSVQFRSLSGSAPSRNYFVWSVDSDNYNTERLEFARGPNGVLFGDGSVGGIATVWTKRANFGKSRTELGLVVDSFGGYRTTADLNRKLNDRIALRLNLLHYRNPGWRDNTEWERDGAHLASTIKLTSRNQFRVEGEVGRFDRQVNPSIYQDQASSWDGTTVFNGTTAPPTGKGIGRISTSAYFLDVPGLPSLGYVNWTNSYQTGGTGLAIEPTQRTDLVGDNIHRFPVVPSREFNVAQPDSVAEIPYYSYSAYLDHRFGDNLFVEVAFNQSQVQRGAPNTYLASREYRIDVNQLLPNGQPNPKFNVPFSDRQRSRNRTDNLDNELRLLAAWRGSLGPVAQNINFIAGSRGGDYFDIQELVARTNGTNPNVTAAENVYRVRLYWDEPGKYSAGPDLPGFPGYVFGWVPSSVTDQTTRLNYAQMAAKSQLWNDRLTILLGARYDDFHRELTTLNGVRDPVTGYPAMGNEVVTDISTESYNGGVVYFPINWLGLYGNYSETFAPPGAGAGLLDGSAPDISRSRGHDVGIKLNALGGKVAGSINYYSSEQAGQLAYSNPQQSIINRIWTNMSRADRIVGNFRDTQDFRGSGFEVELTANPTKNIRLLVNYAKPKTEAVELLPGLRAYYHANVETWQAAGNDLNNPNRSLIQSDITTIQAALDGAVEGVSLDASLDYTANIYGTYSFTSGKLKGLAIGTGANVRGRAKIGASPTDPFDYYKAKSFYLMSAHVSYARRFGKVNAKFQLNVTNLLENDDLIYTGMAIYRPYRPALSSAANPTINVPGTFRYLEPRKLKLSMTFSF